MKNKFTDFYLSSINNIILYFLKTTHLILLPFSLCWDVPYAVCNYGFKLEFYQIDVVKWH